VILDKVFDWQQGLARDLVNYGKTHKRLGGNWHYENRYWRASDQPVDWVCHHGELKKGLAAEKYGIRTPKFRGFLKIAVGGSADLSRSQAPLFAARRRRHSHAERGNENKNENHPIRRLSAYLYF